MADYDDAGAPESLNVGRLAAHGMVVGAVLLVVVGIAYAGGAVATFNQAIPATWMDFLHPLLLLVGAWGLAALLWGGAEILRRLIDVADAQRMLAPSAPALAMPIAARPRAGEGRAEATTHLIEEMVELLRELRDIELLSEDERAAKLRHESDEQRRQLERDVPGLLREHNLQEAERRVQRARQRFPGVPVWDELMAQIDQARAKFEEHDIVVATREVDDLAALGAWDRAAEVVRAVRQRHPNAEQVVELARRVAIGRERASAEERARIMSQAQDATNRRDWPRALELVETLLARFPGSPEAAELRAQLATLKSNAEIQTRQTMERQLRELVRQQRFGDALRLAHDIMERYPDSPQANALREQLPRLEQRVAQAAAR